ncbi:MAG: alpha/beta hydrolase [Clostridia bacterium]|nr:alpha/beta hydrolase [Bacillota bacterium]MBO2521375.1 alpha/beta hydrolase [Bacillota bacterium]
MHEAEFQRFRSQLFALYDQKAYAEALALIDEKGGAFSDFESDILFWRACLAGRLGDRDGALAALRKAAERGYWYHERMLRDPDLDGIRDSEELAELQNVFLERYQRAQAEARPDRRVWEPRGAARGLLVALHGGSGSLASEGELWRPAAEWGWRVAALQSSQVLAPGRFHWSDRGKALEEVRAHLAALGAERSAVLAGFSQGAALAIRWALSQEVPAQGFLAVAPSFRMEQVAPLVDGAPRGLKGYIVIGTGDWCYASAKELAAALAKAGLACFVEARDGLGHDYPPAFEESLRRGLEFLQA